MTSDSREKAKSPDSREAGKVEPGKDGLDVNTVLRRAYKSAVDEKVPSSLLDLLEKLN
jgi:hypothetical protein